MKIQLALLTGFLVSCVWSEDADRYGEDFIDPSDMVHFDAVSHSMRDSKQRKVNGMLRQYILRTLKRAEKLVQSTDEDEDVHFEAKITFNRQILEDFLKCIEKHDCEPTIFEEHLQNINTKLNIDKESEDQLAMYFDKSLKVAIFYYVFVGFLGVVKKFTLPEWLSALVGIIALVGQRYWVFDSKVITGYIQDKFSTGCIKQWEGTIEDISILLYLIIVRATMALLVTVVSKYFKWIFDKKQPQQIEQRPEDFENLCPSVQEQNDVYVNDEEPRVERNQELCRSQSPDSPQESSESSNDSLKNRKDRKQLLKHPNQHEDSIGSTSTTSVCERIDKDIQQGPEDISLLYRGEEETSDSESFMVIEEEEDSRNEL